MTTITATPDTSTASIQLAVTYTAPITRVLRNDANGITEVRTLAGQLPTGNTGTLILSDYEAAAGINTYNAYVDEWVTRTNRATNPVPGNVNGWTTSSSYVKTFETVLGRPAMVVTKSGAGSYIWYGRNAGTLGTSTGTPTTTAGLVAVTAGEQVLYQIDMGTAVTGADAWIVARFFNSSGTEIANSSVTLGTTTLATNSWETLSGTATVPTGASYTYMENVVSYAALGGERAWAGRVYIGSPGGYFDGTTTGTTDLTYQWTGTPHASTSTEKTHQYLVAASATLVLDKPWLMVPVMPNYALQVESVTAYGSDRHSSSTVHQIIGRADPLISFGPLGTRTGSLEIFCPSLQAARDIESVFTRGEAVMLKQNVEGMDMYFVGSSTGIKPYSAQGEDTRYALSVNYTEINRPIASLAGALGWDFNALAAAYPSFDVVTATFATFDDLTIRKER